MRDTDEQLANARSEYKNLTGDIARIDAQLARAKAVGGALAARHQARAEHLAPHARDMRGSALEDQYQDEIRRAHYARALNARSRA